MLQQNLDAIKSRCITSTPIHSIGFVFNGQGAAWNAMGRELIKSYPIYKRSLEEANEHFSELGATWDVFGIHSRTIATIAASTKINR